MNPSRIETAPAGPVACDAHGRARRRRAPTRAGSEVLRAAVDDAGEDVPARARAVLHLADGLRRRQRAAEALGPAEVAVDLFDQTEQSLGAVRARRLLGGLLTATGRYDEAAQRLREARAWLDEARVDPVTVAHCARATADALRQAGHLEQSQQELARARAGYEAAGAGLWAAECDVDLGVLHHQLGAAEPALALLARARPQLLAARARTSVASCDFDLGYVLHDLGRLDDAVECLQLAHSIFDVSDRLDAVAACNQNLGAVLSEMDGRVDESPK